MRRASGADAGLAIARAPGESLPGRIHRAIDASCGYLLNRQTSQGCWVGELEGDSTLLSDYVLLQLWLYQPDVEGNWNPPTRQRVAEACRRILRGQQDDGGWSLFPGGPSNVSASVKAYCALRIGGVDAGAEPLRRAARRICALGGAEAANSYTKLYLSYFGLFPRAEVPSIPPEIFLLPPQNRFSVYAMSAWSRAMLAPLSILDATKAYRPPSNGLDLHEIRSGRQTKLDVRISWKGFFLLLDKTIKLLESTPAGRDRTKAIEAARDWMLARLERSDGLAAIFPAMMNSIMALTQLGYGLEHPLLQRQLKHFEQLVLDDEQGFRVQPCQSPVWDTALTMFAIGRARHHLTEPVRWALTGAADWLLAKQVRHRGDWSVRNPAAQPGGWYFEYANEHYPDTDDTAQVLLALEWAEASDPTEQREAERRGLEWLASMQSSDGGWAAFDVDNSAAILNHVPFADHNAMLDPSCADISGRVLEALCRRAPGRYSGRVRRGIKYLLRTQEVDGCWYGRWGVNYIYGTCFAVRGLRAAGIGPKEAPMLRASEWIRSVQNSDGGWGESPSSYDYARMRALGESTPTQTAWALLALFATDDFESESVEGGVRYLLGRQGPHGNWSESAWTGIGFPRVFYLRYHMYPQVFPLMALGEFVHRKGWKRQ